MCIKLMQWGVSVCSVGAVGVSVYQVDAMGCQCVISWGVSLCDGGQSGVSRCEFGQVSLDVAQGKWTFGVMGVSVCSVGMLGGQCVLS